MDFDLTDNQKMYVDTVQKFVKNQITPRILQLEKDHKFPWQVIETAWKLGILNLSIPESVKGYEVDPVSTALIIKELSYGDTGLSTSAMCNDLANIVIAQHGDDRQKSELLGPFVEGPILALFLPHRARGWLGQFRHDIVHPEGRGRRIRPEWGQVLHYQRFLCLPVHRLLQGREAYGEPAGLCHSPCC